MKHTDGIKKTEMKERFVEQKLVEAVRELGGLALKFVSPGLDGVPDRLVLLPGGRCLFAELKAPGEKPRRIQRYRIEALRALGFQVEVIDDPARIPTVLARAQEGAPVLDIGRVVTLRKPYRMPAPESDDALFSEPVSRDP